MNSTMSHNLDAIASGHTAPSCLRAPCPLPSPRAFTFIEVLFAIIILGVGMIMVAALLPVAIQQTAEVKDDVVSRNVAENALSTFRNTIADADHVRPTGDDGVGQPFFTWHRLSAMASTAVRPNPSRPPYPRQPLINQTIYPLRYPNIVGESWADRVSPFMLTLGERVYSPDPRFQWIPFWSLPGSGAVPTTPQLELRALVTRIRNVDQQPDYAWTEPTASTPRSHFDNPDNGPHVVSVVLIDGTDTRDEADTHPDVTTSYTTGSLPTGFDLQSVGLVPGPSAPDLAVFIGDGGSGAPLDAGPLVAEEGAFLIIAAVPDDLRDTDRAELVGRVYRLGRQRPDLSTSSNPRGVWELDPTFDIQTPFDSGNPSASLRRFEWRLNRDTSDPDQRVLAWIVGRGLRNPALPYNATSNPYVGPAQDLFISEPLRID